VRVLYGVAENCYWLTSKKRVYLVKFYLWIMVKLLWRLLYGYIRKSPLFSHLRNVIPAVKNQRCMSPFLLSDNRRDVWKTSGIMHCAANSDTKYTPPKNHNLHIINNNFMKNCCNADNN